MGSKSYSKGISWFSDCRIPFVDDDKPTGGFGGARIGYGNEYEYDGVCGIANTQGRFPANILVSDDMLNDGVIGKSGKINTNLLNIKGARYNNNSKEKLDYGYERGFNDKGSNSRYYDIDKWFDNLIDV